MCRSGKRCYSGKPEAKRQIKNMLLRGFANTGKLSAYRCHFCGFFHVGNRKPWLAKR